MLQSTQPQQPQALIVLPQSKIEPRSPAALPKMEQATDKTPDFDVNSRKRRWQNASGENIIIQSLAENPDGLQANLNVHDKDRDKKSPSAVDPEKSARPPRYALSL
jgi:hypothetical protein